MNIFSIALAKRLTLLISAFLVVGCAGINTFNQYAKSGETVAVAVGWQPDWSRDNISVWVTPNGGVPTQYPADDPRIRAVVNFYPDPLSSMVVSNRTMQNITPSAQSYGNLVTGNFTSGSRDWFETVVFFDLPDPMALGEAEVYVEEVADVNNFMAATVDIVGTGGTPHDFTATLAGPLLRQHLASLERASHYTIDLSGTIVPHAVQLEFTHDPDVDNSGVGRAYVVEPISGIKNISWTDDGTTLRVIVMPANGITLAGFEGFRFYIAGGIVNLSPSSTQAFDINGGDVAGVSTTVTPHNIVIKSSS